MQGDEGDGDMVQVQAKPNFSSVSAAHTFDFASYTSKVLAVILSCCVYILQILICVSVYSASREARSFAFSPQDT
jgi:hypothetical protein